MLRNDFLLSHEKVFFFAGYVFTEKYVQFQPKKRERVGRVMHKLDWDDCFSRVQKPVGGIGYTVKPFKYALLFAISDLLILLQ